MRRSVDALRSLKRYVALGLGDDWEVRLAVEQGTFSRPAAQVLAATPQQISGPKYVMDIVQTFAIHAFPEPGNSVEESLFIAAEAEDSLLTALRIGVGDGHAARVPLYDYENVAFDEGSTNRNYPDYARVLDFSLNRIQNPSDELLFTVSAEVRLGWRRNGLVASTGRTASEVRLNIDTT